MIVPGSKQRSTKEATVCSVQIESQRRAFSLIPILHQAKYLQIHPTQIQHHLDPPPMKEVTRSQSLRGHSYPKHRGCAGGQKYHHIGTRVWFPGGLKPNPPMIAITTPSQGIRRRRTILAPRPIVNPIPTVLPTPERNRHKKPVGHKMESCQHGPHTGGQPFTKIRRIQCGD